MRGEGHLGAAGTPLHRILHCPAVVHDIHNCWTVQNTVERSPNRPQATLSSDAYYNAYAVSAADGCRAVLGY